MVERTEAQSRVLERIAVQDRGHESPCWVSDRVSQPNGYTKLGYLGRTWLTHRFAYTAFIGEIPEGLQLDHLCRVRACCNPWHLQPVTCRENLLRGDTIPAREAAVTHCPHGHEYTEATTYWRPDGSGKRECLTCRRAWRARRAA